MNLYYLLHTHRHGVSVYHFKSKLSVLAIDKYRVAEDLEIEFDAHEGEDLELHIITQFPEY
jgi:hypothetical protein